MCTLICITIVRNEIEWRTRGTYKCHIVPDGYKCRILDAKPEHAHEHVGRIEREGREDPRCGVYRMVTHADVERDV